MGIFLVLGFMIFPASNAFGTYSAIQDITTAGNSNRGLGFNDNLDFPSGSVINSNGVYFAWDELDTTKKDLTFAFVDRFGVLRVPIVIDSTTVNNTMIWQDILIFAQGNTIDIIATKENGTNSHYIPTHYRSTDDGVNWSTGHPMVSSTQAGGNGVFVADPIWADVDGDDMVMIYNDRANPSAGSFQIRSVTSSDGGTNWSSPVTIIADPLFNAQQYVVEQTPTGTHIHVSYSNSTAIPDELYYTRSTNGGTSYTTPIAVSTDHDDISTQTRIFLDGSDVLIMFIDGTANNFAQVKSTNNGDSFGSQTEINDGAICDAIEDFGDIDRYTQDKNDPSTIYITCTGNGGGNNYYMKTTDFGDTWSTPSSTTSGDTDSSFEPSISADGNLVVVVHNVFNGTFNKNMIRTSEDSGSTWSSETISCVGVCEFPNVNAQAKHIRVEGGFVWFGYSNTTGNNLLYNFQQFVVPDSTPPVISTTVSEPIPITQDSVFDEFEFVSCIDDTDGDITNSMATVGSVDTSAPRTYFVDYTCTDVVTNQSTLQVSYIIKRPPSSGKSPTPTLTVTPSPPTPTTTIPPLSLVPSEEPPRRTLDEIFDLFAQLFEEVEPTPTLEFVPEPESVTEIPAPLFEPTPTEEVRPSFIESIQNFFARLFR